jgi:hypothetical protein
MKVQELIEKLQSLHAPTLDVYIISDQGDSYEVGNSRVKCEGNDEYCQSGPLEDLIVDDKLIENVVTITACGC